MGVLPQQEKHPKVKDRLVVHADKYSRHAGQSDLPPESFCPSNDLQVRESRHFEEDCKIEDVSKIPSYEDLSVNG